MATKQQWLDAGVGAEHILAWFEAGCTPAEAGAWESVGATPDNYEDEGRALVLAWQREHGAGHPALGIECQCGAGDGCDQPATCTDHGSGVPVCAGCRDGAVWSDDGDSDCSCCGSGDRVVWDATAGHSGEYVYDASPAAPAEDDDGEWAVIGMDGEEHGRYATREEAQQAIDREATLFGRSLACCGSAYLPRSVCHVACGEPRRAGQWSTSWGVGCKHEECVAD